MDIAQVVEMTFVLLQAEWDVEKSRQLIEQVKSTHVIVHRSDPQDYYYLYTREQALTRLEGAPSSSTVHAAFDLHEAEATPLIEVHTRADDAPDRCVVHEDGRLVGFFDATQPPLTGGVRGTEPRRFPAEGRDITATVAPRSLLADLPETLVLNETVSLLVSLSAAPEPAGRALPIDLPIGATLDVVVQPKRGFVIEGRSEGSLVVSSAEETLPLQFRVRGTEVGPGQIRVLAFHQGQSLGLITVTATVTETRASLASLRASHERPLASVSIRQPDLSLWIWERREAGETVLDLLLTAPDPGLQLNLKRFGPIRLRTDPFQYFQDFFNEIENLPLTTDREKRIAEQRLAAKGTNLFRTLFPTELQEQLWALRERIQSVQVQSEEPWIPWELCKLYGRENGRVIEGPFLCEAFAVTRWLPGLPRLLDLKLKNMAVVVPADSGLPFAPSERDYLLSLADGNRKVTRVPATFLDVRRELASGQYDGWHFSGHGGFRTPDPNRSAMYLEHQETLTPEEICGEVSNLGVAQPLVFLNACQIGRSAMALTDIGGWASQFVRAGAGAFVGAYWSIYDKPAYDFAQAFYGRLLTGVPIGRAAQEARAAIRSTGDPTWLAYTVFADPLAIVQPS